MDGSALITAIQNGDREGALAALADPNSLTARGSQGESAVQLAAYYGQADLARDILALMPSPDMHSACAAGSADHVAAALAGTNVEEMSQDGFTPLSLAAAFNEDSVVRVLLERGADPNARSRSLGGVAPLHAAVFGRKPDNVRALVQAGADPNSPQQDGFTALHGAAQNGDAASVEILLEAGADRAARTGEGKTPADLAAGAGHSALASRLAQA